jgi:hypothetical protein
VGFIADPDDLEPESRPIVLNEDEKNFVIRVVQDEDEEDDEPLAVENPPRRASSGGDRGGAGPRSRMTPIAAGVGVFVDELGVGTSWARQTGPMGRPAELSPVARSRVVGLLEESAGGLPIARLRRVIRRGRRTKAADDDYARLALGIAVLRTSRPIRVSHLAEVLECDPATVWRLKMRGQQQLQDFAGQSVGTGAQQMAA